jgi:hypothetical protein
MRLSAAVRLGLASCFLCASLSCGGKVNPELGSEREAGPVNIDPGAGTSEQDAGAVTTGRDADTNGSVLCPVGQKSCGTSCVALDDPTYGCGAPTCDPSACPATNGGTLACQGGACVIGSCGAGTKKCGDRCVPADKNNGCGEEARCNACAVNETCEGMPVTRCNCIPDNATACLGKQCGPTTNNCGQAFVCPDTCGGRPCGTGGVGLNVCGDALPACTTKEDLGDDGPKLDAVAFCKNLLAACTGDNILVDWNTQEKCVIHYAASYNSKQACESYHLCGYTVNASAANKTVHCPHAQGSGPCAP